MNNSNSIDSNNNDITIVYKTYNNDLHLIYYSLLSVKKFVSGIKEMIIYCHDACLKKLQKLVNNINLSNIEYRIIPVSYDYHGYLKQMVVKSICFKDVNTKYIVMLDSDNIINTKINFNDLIEPSGQIEWYYLNNIPKDYHAMLWKEAYETMTKTKQNVYYMANNFPFIFTKKSLNDAYNKFIEMHGIDYDTFCKNGCEKYNIKIENSIAGNKGRFVDMAKIFTELEWLGYYCHHFSEDYIFKPVELKSKKSILIQVWSHGGLTNDIKKQIDTILQ
jgi:hypothetical protein